MEKFTSLRLVTVDSVVSPWRESNRMRASFSSRPAKVAWTRSCLLAKRAQLPLQSRQSARDMSEPALPGGVTGRRRAPLDRESVLRGAVAVADAGGIGGLTIRSLAQELSVKADDRVLLRGEQGRDPRRHRRHLSSDRYHPPVGGDWRAEITERARSARRVLRRHPWATPLLESRRTPGPAGSRPA